MIVRRQFRGCFKELEENGVNGREQALEAARREAERWIKEGSILCLSLYQWNQMCFLHCEAEGNVPQPESMLSALSSCLETWPEEDGRRNWAPMYPVYYHCIPDETVNWQRGRIGKKRIGRIAFLKEEKLASYLYWHKALVDEGLFTGDQYQYISFHENLLFSYYEEPKIMVNIRGSREKSSVIDKWMQQDPASHFDREKAGGENFCVMKELLFVGKENVHDC